MAKMTKIQARVLGAMTAGRPLLTRAKLAERAGFTPLSGCPTRALNGLREGSSSGKAHPGLLELGYLCKVELDIDGLVEVCYQITDAGVKAYQEYMSSVGSLGEMRARDVSTNRRYKVDME